MFNRETVVRELVAVSRMLVYGGIQVRVNELPIGVKKALKEVKYNRRDISVEKGTTYYPSMAMSYGGGYRGYLLIVDVLQGVKKAMKGSWGGPNPWEKSPVDMDDTKYSIPNGCVVVYGNEGHRVSATIVAPPEMLEEFEDEEGPDLTDKEKKALDVIGSIKSSYRREEFRREGLGMYEPKNLIIQSLADKGLVKVTKVGISITTEGRNARR